MAKVGAVRAAVKFSTLDVKVGETRYASSESGLEDDGGGARTRSGYCAPAARKGVGNATSHLAHAVVFKTHLQQMKFF